MDGDIEAAGALVTVAGAAAALEPDAAHGSRHGEACPNCGAEVNGKFCAQCGQVAHVHRSLAHAVEELLHGVWHFDSKLWNTLPLLVTRPGKLTRDYVMGRRARYISPFGLFLLTIFLMFFVFGLLGGVQLPDTGEVKVAAKVAVGSEEGVARLAELDRSIADLDRDIALAEKDPAKADDLAGMRLARQGFVAARAIVVDASEGKLESSEGPAWAAVVKQAAERGDVDVSLPSKTLDAKVRKALKNPELALYKVQQKGYKLSFLLLPMSLPWMMLLFAWKRDVRAYDHVVFLLYSISFMSMVALTAVLLTMAGFGDGAVSGILLLVIPPLHMFMQMKGAYQLSTASALWRTVALIIFSLVTLTLYFALIAVLGLVD